MNGKIFNRETFSFFSAGENILFLFLFSLEWNENPIEEWTWTEVHTKNNADILYAKKVKKKNERKILGKVNILHRFFDVLNGFQHFWNYIFPFGFWSVRSLRAPLFVNIATKLAYKRKQQQWMEKEEEEENEEKKTAVPQAWTKRCI